MADLAVIGVTIEKPCLPLFRTNHAFTAELCKTLVTEMKAYSAAYLAGQRVRRVIMFFGCVGAKFAMGWRSATWLGLAAG